MNISQLIISYRLRWTIDGKLIYMMKVKKSKKGKVYGNEQYVTYNELASFFFKSE
jgi:hypothetical protein